MNLYITSILLVSTLVQLVASAATLTLPTSANCGNPALLTCTSTECTSGYRFFRGNNVLYNNLGPLSGISDPDRYFATVRSDSEVQLTITNIQYSDAAQYACSCGFNKITTGQTLVYQCKASTSSASVTSDKKLSITVDSLYPEPSSIVTTNTTNTLQGAQMCRSSSTLASHFRCSWDSTTSFPDGIHSYTIAVTTVTQAAPVSGLFRIVTPTSPNISNLVTISNNRQVLRGVQDTPLTIQCVSKGGIPAPTLAWYRGSTSTSPLAQSTTSDSVPQSDGTYTVTLIHTFIPSRRDDMTPFLCRVFYPGATTGATPDPSPASAILYLDLKPSSPTVSQTGEAASGENMTFRCSSTNGRPAPNITWFYRGQTFTPTNTLSFDQTSETYTVVSVLQRPVNAEDNGQTATCRVLHTTLYSPLSATIEVNVKFGPMRDSTIIQAVMDTNQILLNCTSGTTNPATNITWYNGSKVMPNTEGYTRWPGIHNGLITSNILTITPTRYMDGDRVTCRSDNGYGSDSTYVNIDIPYPPLVQTLLNKTAVEGEPDIAMRCSASSKPPANFTWYKENTVLTSGMGTFTDNSFSYIIPHMGRTDAGSYICQAGNNVGSTDSKIMYLTVKYPPTVTVLTTTFPSYTVTCTADGYPDRYTYQDWVQIWPGYGPVATIQFTGTTLTWTDSSYERSGVYVCSVSNGVAVYGTNVSFMRGNTTIVITAPPILTDPFPDGTRVLLAGRLGQNASMEITYWSNVKGSIVRCYKLKGGTRSSKSSCSVTEKDINITLPVYNHKVTETGTFATITMHMTSLEDFTDYDIVVSNSIQGESILGIQTVPQGPPEAPTIEGNFSITPGQVILTVLPGFHRGYNQTLVFQISTDLTTWINKTSVYIGMKNRPTDVLLVSLRENTLYHVRVFAYNTEGRSNHFSTVTNFTTTKDIAISSNSTATVAGSVVAGVVILTVFGLGLFLYKRYKYSCQLKRKGTKSSEDVQMTKSQNIYEAAVATSDSAHVYSKLHQPEHIVDAGKRLDNTGLYETPASPTSPEHNYAVLSETVSENVYVNLTV